MLIYKMLGGACLLSSGLWVYFVRDKFEKKKCIQLDAYINLLKHIKNQVECYMKPIDLIISSCSSDLITLCGISQLENLENVEKMLDKASFYIDDDAIDMLYSFSKDYGKGYLDEQIKSCEKYTQALEELRAVYYDKRRKDKKLSLAISISISLSLFLILL